MSIKKKELEQIVSDALDEFYKRRINKLSGLKLKQTLRRKNPYLFRAIGTNDAAEIVEQILTAYMSSSDEGIFGDAFFEPVAKAVSKGRASTGEGVDITKEDGRCYKAIAVKSGPSVFNAQSRRRQNQDFQALRSRLRKVQMHFDAIVGYSYGRKISEANDTKIFRELSGQAFWEELTGDENFYLKILHAMREKPEKHRTQYMIEWDKAKNRFAKDFMDDFCHEDGSIDWDKFLEFNSGTK